MNRKGYVEIRILFSALLKSQVTEALVFIQLFSNTVARAVLFLAQVKSPVQSMSGNEVGAAVAGRAAGSAEWGQEPP